MYGWPTTRVNIVCQETNEHLTCDDRVNIDTGQIVHMNSLPGRAVVLRYLKYNCEIVAAVLIAQS